MAPWWLPLSFPTTTSLSVCSIYLTSGLRTFGFLVCCHLLCSALQSRAEIAAAHTKQSMCMLTVGSGGLFHEGHQMGYWELMVALDVSCLSPSFTLGFWGFISQGVLDGLLRVDGSPWCELSPLTFFVCSIHAAKSFFFYLLFCLRLTSLFSYIQIHLFVQNRMPCAW